MVCSQTGRGGEKLSVCDSVHTRVCVCVWERGEFAHEANTREGVGTEVQKGSDEDECECVHAWKRAVVRRENNKEVYSFLHTRGPMVGG